MNGADLVCIVHSNVPADWSVWLKTDQAGNNQNITDDKHMTRSRTSGPVKELVLQIRNATEQDAGIYTCEARNRANETIRWPPGTGYLMLSRGKVTLRFILIIQRRVIQCI